VPEVCAVVGVVLVVFDEDVSHADRTSTNRSKNKPMIDLEIAIQENERVSAVEVFFV
jgi:hypothetical protein